MAENTTTGKNSGRKKGLPNPIKILLVLTASVVIGGYAGGTAYYHGHFFPNTEVGGIPCANQTAGYVESKNILSGNAYALTITDRRDNRFTIQGKDFSYAYSAKGEEASILRNQRAWAWPYEVFRTHEENLDRSFTYDSDQLSALVDSLEIFSESYMEAPEDAYLEITETGYQVVPEVSGTTLIPEQVLAEITQAIDNQETSVTLSDACYVTPQVYADDESIQKTASQLDLYTASTVHYEIDGADEDLTPEKILSFLDISPEGDVSINEGKVAQFVQYLASTYNTYGDVRTFRTSNGDDVRIGGGDYGWVVNKTAETEQLIADLKGGSAVSREPVYEQRAIKSGLDDIGSTYVEIDYTNQHLWYYRSNTLVVETDIVSGNISRGNGSPDGVFKIVYCQRDATLVGEDYASKVKYFMPFAYNVGIHDASWRSSFGGEIYKKSGSHGCINVPEEAARTIIDDIDLGTPVIAYYREPVKLTAENARISNAYSYAAQEAR